MSEESARRSPEAHFPGELLSPEKAEDIAEGWRGVDNWDKKGRLMRRGDFFIFYPSDNPLKVYNEPKCARIAVPSESDTLSPEVRELKMLNKIPTPLVWEILEADLRSFVWKIDFPSGETYSLVARKLENELPYTLTYAPIKTDVETAVRMREEILDYLKDEVKKENMPEQLLETAEGLVEFLPKAPLNRSLVKLERGRGRRGGSRNDPIIEQKFIYTTSWNDFWDSRGEVKRAGQYIVYKRKDRSLRNVQIVVGDKEGRFCITKTAWNILRTVPGDSEEISIRDSLDMPVLSLGKAHLRKGKWRMRARPLVIDTAVLKKSQELIKDYIAKEVDAGRLPQKALDTVNGIIRFKHSTLEPYPFYRRLHRYEGSLRKTNRVKQKEKPKPPKEEVKEVTYERPKLIKTIIEQARAGRSEVVARPSDLEDYLKPKTFPMGAGFKRLNISTAENSGKIEGVINVPIPIVGGDINFYFEVRNDTGGKRLRIENPKLNTESGFLQEQLGTIWPYLENINSLIIDDVDEQLRSERLQVTGISITKKGEFSLQIRRAQPNTS